MICTYLSVTSNRQSYTAFYILIYYFTGSDIMFFNVENDILFMNSRIGRNQSNNDLNVLIISVQLYCCTRDGMGAFNYSLSS